ncbi:MAG: TonB-dependent receptor [Algibacter sp.]|uniref:TonB-dependent receptor n=1 Tax=Algibacter sp. TaxID=1872428 RepID=UPI00260F46DF|nr:TonB-dependent receptor [Algibacter sp.]MDG1728692.1 TonB-dependent receptor [Algibacter sp.]MDG2178489.1 TonB-dependent receptor [Algibacter sp.]
MKHYIMIIACCLFNITYGQNCNYKLSGNVRDFHDGSAITGATIYIETLDRYTTSNIEGNYTIENLCKGLLILEVSHLGCETKRIEVQINGDTQYEINMEHHIEELNEVKIDASGNPKLTKTSQETQLKTKTLERFSAFSLGDALKQVSGVSSINTGNTIVKPVINGLHSSRIVVMTNNVRLQDQEWGIEHAPNIDLNSAGHINVIKGANALAYGGDAIGGVIVLKPKTISLKDSLYGKTILGAQSNGSGYNVSSSLTKSWKKGWYATGQGSYKRFGDFETPDYYLTNTGMNSKGLSLNTGFETFEKGFNIFYSYLNNEIGILRASHIGSVEDLVNAINSQEPFVKDDFSYDINAPRQEVTHQIIKADFYKRFKKFGRLEVQYDFQNNQRFEYDVRVGDDRDKPALDLTLKTHTIKSDLKIDSKTNAIYKFGVNASLQNNFANPDTGVRRLIPDYDKYDFGIYAVSDFKLGDNTNLDVGLRYDFNRIDAKKFYRTSRWEERGYDEDFADIVIDDLGTQLLTNPVLTYHNVSASAGITHQFNAHNSVIFNYGLSNRAPNPSELFSDGLHHSAARIELGDLRIKQETSNRIGASYLFKNEKLSLNLESFLNHINDYIFIKPTGTELTIRGAFPVWDYVQTDALLYGLDVSANYKFNKQWFLNNKTAFIKGRDLTEKEALIDIPAFKTVNSIGYSNKKWLNFNAELQSELVLEQNAFPDNNFEVFIPTTEELVLLDISSPPPTYHLVHFESDITVKLSKKTDLNIGLNITNIFNTSYREYLNRLRYFADDLGRNFMLQLKLNY